MHIQLLKILNLIAKKDLNGLVNTIDTNQKVVSKLYVEKIFNLNGGGYQEDIQVMTNKIKNMEESYKKLTPVLKSITEMLNSLPVSEDNKINSKLEILKEQLIEMEKILTNSSQQDPSQQEPDQQDLNQPTN